MTFCMTHPCYMLGRMDRKYSLHLSPHSVILPPSYNLRIKERSHATAVTQCDQIEESYKINANRNLAPLNFCCHVIFPSSYISHSNQPSTIGNKMEQGIRIMDIHYASLRHYFFRRTYFIFVMNIHGYQRMRLVMWSKICMNKRRETFRCLDSLLSIQICKNVVVTN